MAFGLADGQRLDASESAQIRDADRGGVFAGGDHCAAAAGGLDGYRGDMLCDLRPRLLGFEFAGAAYRSISRKRDGHRVRILGHGGSGRRHPGQLGDRLGGAKLFLRADISHGGLDASALGGAGLLAAAGSIFPQGGVMLLLIALTIFDVVLILAPLVVALPLVAQTPELLW